MNKGPIAENADSIVLGTHFWYLLDLGETSTLYYTAR